MYISFRENVYFTAGTKRSTISNYETLNLYHLTDEETAFIQKIIGKEKETLVLTAEEQSDLEFLIETGILTYSNRYLDGTISHKYPCFQIDFAWIEVTTRCNLKCRHCYDESDLSCQNEMTLSEFKYAVEELKSLGVKGIQIIGGEPLVVGGQIFEMLEYSRALFDSVEIFTNGTLISGKNIDYFSKNKVKVALSVYSNNPQDHDKVTQVIGSHQKTLNAISLLAENHVQYRVANVLMKNIDVGENTNPLFTLSKRRDIVRMCGRGNLSLLSRPLLKRKLITKETFSAPLNNKLLERIKLGHNCFARRLYIGADLTVYPCVMERRIYHGNLKNDHLKNILNENIFTLGKDKIKECKDCEFRYCCFDCRPDALSEDIYAKPWNCTYNPYTGSWADIEDFITGIEKEYDVKFD